MNNQINEFSNAVAVAGIVNLTTGEVIKTVTDIQLKAGLYDEVKFLTKDKVGDLAVFGFDSQTEVLISNLESALGASAVIHVKYLYSQFKVAKISSQLAFEEGHLVEMKEARAECLAHYQYSPFVKDERKAAQTRRVFSEGIKALESLVDTLKAQIDFHRFQMGKITQELDNEQCAA